MSLPPDSIARISPIGLLDSGVGGLSVWREVARLAPAHDLLYFADQAYVPYGERPASEIIARSRHITRFFLDRGCAAVVVACNTASAAALETLRRAWPDVPFIGMEPAVKPAASLTHAGVVGVLATHGTLEGDLFGRTKENYARDVQVIVRTAPGLVERIEAGDLDSAQTRDIVRRAVDPMVEAGADVVALGCTHYPFVSSLLHELYGPGLTLLDPSDAVARQTLRVLQSRGLYCESGTPGQRVFITSGNPEQFAEVLEKLVGQVGGPVLYHE